MQINIFLQVTWISNSLDNGHLQREEQLDDKQEQGQRRRGESQQTRRKKGWRLSIDVDICFIECFKRKTSWVLGAGHKNQPIDGCFPLSKWTQSKTNKQKKRTRWENKIKNGVHINDELIFRQHAQRVELQRWQIRQCASIFYSTSSANRRHQTRRTVAGKNKIKFNLVV